MTDSELLSLDSVMEAVTDLALSNAKDAPSVAQAIEQAETFRAEIARALFVATKPPQVLRREQHITVRYHRGHLQYLFTLPGAPRTKKNHGEVIQRGRRRYHVPSAAFRAWEAQCYSYVLSNSHQLLLELAGATNCAAIFYRDADAGDAVGYYQGLADVLEKCRIVTDDKIIRSWDGSELRRALPSDQAGSPRTEVTLTILGSATTGQVSGGSI